MAKKKGSGLAQSGGKASTFGGGKGGTKLSKGVTSSRTIDRARNSAGLDVAIRSPEGDLSMVRESFRVGGTPPQTTGGDQTSIKSKRKVRGPSRGGSS
jgi:hypothetical protein